MPNAGSPPTTSGSEALYAEAVSRRAQGMGRHKGGDHAGALALFEQAADLFARAGSPLQRAWTLQNQGLVLEQLGRGDHALARFAEATAVMVAHGDAAGIPLMNRRRGDLLRRRGDQPAARAEYAIGLARYRADHEPNGVINTLSSIAASHLAQDDVAAAKAALDDALVQLQSYPRRSGEYDYLLLARLAETERRLGYADLAQRFAADAAALAATLDLAADRSNPDVIAYLHGSR